MEHCRSKPERSGKPGGDVLLVARSSKLRTGETQYIVDGGTSAVSESDHQLRQPGRIDDAVHRVYRQK
jgi:hypothetical protein